MKKRMFKKPLRASSTYQDNLNEELLIEENDTSLLNHQNFGDILVDPESDLPEDTHKPVLAKAYKKAKKVKASEVFDDLDVIDESDDVITDDLELLKDPDDFFEDDEILLSEDEEKSEEKSEEEKPSEEKPSEEESVKSASDILSLNETDTMPSDVKPQEKVNTEDALEKTAPEENPEVKQRDGEGEGDAVKVESKKKAKKVKAEEKPEETILDNNQKNGPLTVESSMNYVLVDVDGVKDSVSDVVFASLGKTKLAIHANRVIATMDEDAAKQVSADDIYLEDEYDEATLAEIEKSGLRAGLRRMGYNLASVQLKSDAQVNAQVASLTASAKADMKAKIEARDKVMKDSLILAAVGLNRNIFKDYENSLRNELVASLQNAGVRNASRMVRAAFEKYGADYSKKLMMIASDIADLPEETREGLASQLDMTMEAEEDVVESDPNVFGDPVTGDEDDEALPSVEAALRNPIKASIGHREVSVDAPLPFVHY